MLDLLIGCEHLRGTGFQPLRVALLTDRHQQRTEHDTDNGREHSDAHNHPEHQPTTHGNLRFRSAAPGRQGRFLLLTGRSRVACRQRR
ncbi:hypothetical protein [Dactylosporangium darangshiense]|uniref:hypothetical protein n=1 Tax=Dactylosporangium darangshiense TaxID=579108 RepID=UPI00362CD158